MQKISRISELTETVKQWKLQGETVAFVPTMGNLHAGHIKLVTEARNKSDKVVVSVFVNPTQFVIGEDFAGYPRTEDDDEEKLKSVAIDLLFLPTEKEMYLSKSNTIVSVVELSKLHCGASRPGHFDGVATIVAKLFNIVQPDLAFFGEKDFQQLMVIRRMVQDLNIPVIIESVVTQREHDGLAMSSRNTYLTLAQRAIAPQLYCSLNQAREMILSGETDFIEIEQLQKLYLSNLGFEPDYFSICNADDLSKATDNTVELVILAAAKLGKPRLIDNLAFSR